MTLPISFASRENGGGGLETQLTEGPELFEGMRLQTASKRAWVPVSGTWSVTRAGASIPSVSATCAATMGGLRMGGTGSVADRARGLGAGGFDHATLDLHIPAKNEGDIVVALDQGTVGMCGAVGKDRPIGQGVESFEPISNEIDFRRFRHLRGGQCGKANVEENSMVEYIALDGFRREAGRTFRRGLVSFGRTPDKRGNCAPKRLTGKRQVDKALHAD